MAERRIGTVVQRRDLSPILSILRLVPEEGDEFPPCLAGQYIALRREHCRLTKKIAAGGSWTSSTFRRSAGRRSRIA